MGYRYQQRILNRATSNDQEIHKEVQFNTTLRFHHLPFRLAKKKNTNGSSYWIGCGVLGPLFHYW